MSKIEYLGLKLIPLSTLPATRGVPFLNLVCSKTNQRTIAINKTAFELLRRPEWVQIIANTQYVAVRPCTAKDQHARKVTKGTNNVTAIELAHLFDVKPGERFRIDVEFDEGHVLGEFPVELQERYRAKNGSK